MVKSPQEEMKNTRTVNIWINIKNYNIYFLSYVL